MSNLNKQFRRHGGALVNAIDGVSFDVAAGEFVVLLGPSGCGKTTLLRTVAGLETPDSGDIRLSGRAVYSGATRVDVPPERRDISMIFQSYALWPHMTVFKNVAYPLVNGRSSKLTKDEIARKVGHALDLVGIGDLAQQHPGQMSGGQQQRAALARALVRNDELVLFDEPLSNVDAKVREQLRAELAGMQRELGFSALFVTHDQTEAMELAHRIAVLDNGRIVQFGSPLDIYQRPATRYVATFIGAINEVPGTVRSVDADAVVVDTALGPIVGKASGARPVVGQKVAAVWRPEQAGFQRDESSAPNSWRGTVKRELFGGAHTEYVFDVSGHDVRIWTPRPGGVGAGESRWVTIAVEDVLVLPWDEPEADAEDLELEPARQEATL